MPSIKTQKLKLSTLDKDDNEIGSYTMDISDLSLMHSRIECIMDMSLDDFKPTCDRVGERLCKDLCFILKQIIK